MKDREPQLNIEVSEQFADLWDVFVENHGGNKGDCGGCAYWLLMSLTPYQFIDSMLAYKAWVLKGCPDKIKPVDLCTARAR